jgi:hypothetical protein
MTLVVRRQDGFVQLAARQSREMAKAFLRVLLFGSRSVPWNEKAKASDIVEYSVMPCVSTCLSFVADNHWSSTEDSASDAWKLNFNNGNQNNNNKNNNKRVRAFRK